MFKEISTSTIVFSAYAMSQSSVPSTSVVSERDTCDTLGTTKVQSPFRVLPGYGLQIGCQDAFFPRVSTCSLSVAVVTSPDSSFHNLHHLLLVSRRSEAAVNWQGWSFSRIYSPKLPDCERTLLANNLVFWCSSTNSHSSSNSIATICSFSEVRCLKNYCLAHKHWYPITS